MQLNIIVYGPEASKDTKLARQSAFASYGKHATRVSYSYMKFPGASDQTAVYWVTGEPGNFKIIDKETSNFSAANIESRTISFLSKYPTGKDKGGTGTSKDNTGGNNPVDNKNGTNSGTGEGFGGNIGLPFGAGVFNLEFPFGLPNWLWLIGAGLGAGVFVITSDESTVKIASKTLGIERIGKTVNRKKTVIKIGAATFAAFCTINYLNAKKIPIKLPEIPFLKINQ